MNTVMGTSRLFKGDLSGSGTKSHFSEVVITEYVVHTRSSDQLSSKLLNDKSDALQ